MAVFGARLGQMFGALLYVVKTAEISDAPLGRFEATGAFMCSRITARSGAFGGA